MIRLGLTSSAFLTKSPKEVLDLAKGLKLDAVEWGGESHVPHGDSARAAGLLMDTLRAGLTVAAYAPTYRVDRRGESGLGFGPILEVASALHAPLIRVYVGAVERRGAAAELAPRHAAAEDPADRAALVAELRRLGDLADPRGITICLSLGLRTRLDRYVAARELVDEAAHPFVKAAWEPLPGAEAEAATSSLAEGERGYALLFARRVDREGRPGRLREEPEAWRERLRLFTERAGDKGMGRFVLLGRIGDEDEERLADDAAFLRELALELEPPRRSS